MLSSPVVLAITIVILRKTKTDGWILLLGTLIMLLFLLGRGMPILCQDCSKFSGTGEAFVSASVLPAVHHSGTLLIWGEPEHRWFAVHNGPVLKRRRWRYERVMTPEHMREVVQQHL